MSVVWVVEDEENIREMIVFALNNSSFRARAFSDATGMYRAMESSLPHLFLLDIMLEGEDGYAILERLRKDERTRDIPVIMLTAKSSEYDKVKGLNMGADDFITKPFSVMELISRIRAVLRRMPPEDEPEPSLAVGSLQLEPSSRRVWADGEPVELTYKEFELLYYLLVNRDIVLTRRKLMEELWDFAFDSESRTVDVHIRSLRRKLGKEGKRIRTVRNVGYTIGE